jgi:hypothetical protein
MITIPRWVVLGILVITFFAVVRHQDPVVINNNKVSVTSLVKPSPLALLTPKVIAKELLTPAAYSCWAKIVKNESRFNPKATNPTSSATGIGQLLDSTYKSLGMKPTKDPTAQLVAMIAYINRRFGGDNRMCSAWGYWLKHRSY